MKPLELPPNPVQHFYRGGDRIGALRGFEPETDHQPEEWLGATIPRFGEQLIGLAPVADGTLLRDHVAAAPEQWIGGRGGSDSDTGLLVKLLDARQRLPVHVHPPRDFAVTHLDCPYGKTEAWYVLDAEPDSAVYVGWKEDVDRDELDRRRDAQDSEWMLSNMNRIPVTAGMSMMCPAGTAHAIGAGVFVAEVQEPTDFSILLEWSVTTSTREESHLDLGFDAVMPSVSAAKMGADELQALLSDVGTQPVTEEPASLLAAQADPYFRVLRAGSTERSGDFPQSFAVVVVTEVSDAEGSARLVSPHGTVTVTRGQAFAIPHAWGPWRIEGGTALACLPGVDWPASIHQGGIR